ncbi:MAG: hypothetical protein PHQ43_11795 [Dehalococcoidales bacterium]|nr:hypothetical protein [Dehalococcoidales bacterium]
MKQRSPRVQALLRKATSITHYFVGIIAAWLYPFYPGLAVLAFLSFIAWEYSSPAKKDRGEACEDCHEALIGLVLGILFVIFIKVVLWLNGDRTVFVCV